MAEPNANSRGCLSDPCETTDFRRKVRARALWLELRKCARKKLEAWVTGLCADDRALLLEALTEGER